VDVGLHAAAGRVDFLPRMRQRMGATRLIEDVEYARHGGETLRLDVLQPQGPGPHPVPVYLHGGAFAIGSKRTHRALAAANASQGYLVCNVDYRLARTWPCRSCWRAAPRDRSHLPRRCSSTVCDR